MNIYSRVDLGKPIRAPSVGPSAPRAEAPGAAGGGQAASFSDVLGEAISSARTEEASANEAAAAFADGKLGIHEVMIAQEKAGIAVRYAVTLKNKAVEAYREILNTQI